MINEFEKIKLFGSFIAKEYSGELLRLLYLYKDISASEAASRLGMHIKTVQEFFEALSETGVLEKRIAYESKRPYFRYSFNRDKIELTLDVKELVGDEIPAKKSELCIREKKNADVKYTIARNKLFFSTVTVWSGKGRDTIEKKISLTIPQGKFLFNLPFPNAEYEPVNKIMQKAEVGDEHKAEIMDIVNLLIDYRVIEKKD